MENWMEKFERKKDEQGERELNVKLDKLLDLLDEIQTNKDRIRVLDKIINVYEELRVEAYDYDEKDYIRKKDELAKIRYRIKKEEYMETLESKSWNEYRDEEGIEEERE